MEDTAVTDTSPAAASDCHPGGYYCLKPGTILDKPVIFFGYDDLKSYLTCISMRQYSYRRPQNRRHNRKSLDNQDDSNDIDNDNSFDDVYNDDADAADDDEDDENEDKEVFLEYAIVYNLQDAYNYLIRGILDKKNSTSLRKVRLRDFQEDDMNDGEEVVGARNRKRQKLSTPTTTTTTRIRKPSGYYSPFFTTTPTAKTIPRTPEILPPSHLNEQRRERSKTPTTNSVSKTPATTILRKIPTMSASGGGGGVGGNNSSNVVVKRGRGRPRTLKLDTTPPVNDSNNVYTNTPSSSTVQKKRGRPRKIPLGQNAPATPRRKYNKTGTPSAPPIGTTTLSPVQTPKTIAEVLREKAVARTEEAMIAARALDNEEEKQQNGSSLEETEWETRFNMVLEYKKAYGDCTLSMAGSPFVSVKQWLARQKIYLKLSDKKEKQKCEDNNDGDGDNNFVNSQQDLAKESSLMTGTNEEISLPTLFNEERRKRLLDLIGVSDAKDIDAKEWEEMYAVLEKYKQEHGYVPAIGDQYHETLCPLLFEWFKIQQDYLKIYDDDHHQQNEENPSSSGKTKCPLLPEQRQRLLDIGVAKPPGWNEMIELLEECKSTLGEFPRLKRFKYEVPGKFRALQTWADDVRVAVRQYYCDKEADSPSQESDDDESPKKKKAKTSSSNVVTPNNDDKLTITAERLQQLYDLKFMMRPHKSWDFMFKLFQEYKDEYGTFHVSASRELPEKYNGFKKWISVQRKLVKEYDFVSGPNSWSLAQNDDNDDTAQARCPSSWKMTPDRRKRLADVGAFPMPRFQSEWECMFDLLKEYKEEFGTLCLPVYNKTPDKYRPLSSWMQIQRQTFKEYDEYKQKKESMSGPGPTLEFKPSNSSGFETVEQRQRLLDFGFLIDPQHSKEARQMRYNKLFERKIEDLKAFKAEHGHLNFPKATTLNQWIWRMRRDYKQRLEGKENFLTMDHVSALTAQGVQMISEKTRGPLKTQKERIEDYVAFVKEHGREPLNRSKDFHERTLNKHAKLFRKRRQLMEEGITYTKNAGKCEMSQEEIALLDSVGFRWEVKYFGNPKKYVNLPFETHFERLKEYKAKHGHCEPPKRHPVVGGFVHRMRKEYKYMVEGKLSSMTLERYRMLSEIGFRFQVTETGRRRMRYLDNGSSGYDTSDGDGNGDDGDDDNDNDNKDDSESDDDNNNDNGNNNNNNNYNNNERDISDARDHNRMNYGNDIRAPQQLMALQGGLTWLGF